MTYNTKTAAGAKYSNPTGTEAHETRELTLGESETIVVGNARINQAVADELLNLQGWHGGSKGRELIHDLSDICYTLTHLALHDDANFGGEDAIQILHPLHRIQYSLGLLCKVENYSVGKEMCDDKV